jgi:hypothetical protein
MKTPPASELGPRLAAIERCEAVRRAMARYMDLCDVPREPYDHAELAALFVPHAVWEGTGPEYTGKFGRLMGREAILSMLRSYLPPAKHFRRNVHVLGEGHITPREDSATGRWVMQQVSEYDDGGHELIVARLDVDFEITGSTARISHFRTEKLLSVNPALALSTN